MQFRIYDRQTLGYKDGGYVSSYKIDDDYIVNNNCSIKIVKELNDKVIVGDTIALIQTSGAYHKGTITNVDNADFSITYKSDKELFNDNMLNPFLERFVTEDDEEVKIAGKFGIADVANIIYTYFAETTDWAKILPLKVITEGDVVDDNGNVKMLWNWNNNSINIVDWLVNLFERYNLSLSWTIDFNRAGTIKTSFIDREIVIVENARKPYYIVTLSAIINSGKIIKDNVANQTITYTEKELPEATVCILIDKESKQIIQMSNGTNLINPANIKEHTILSYNEAYGYVQEQDSPGTSVTGYIPIDVTKTYVLSFKGYDGNARRIICYDENQHAFWSFVYNIQNPDETSLYTITLHFTKEQFPDVTDIEDTKYIRINYYINSQEIQIEENEEYTGYDPYDKPAVFYLIDVAGRSLVTPDVNSSFRVFPVKTKIVEFDSAGEDTTEEQVAYENLVPSKFNQAIEIRISKDSKTFDFENVLFGDQFEIINQDGIIQSNYTGRKEESGNKWVTLYFGLGRQNYTDLVQMRMRKQKYATVYNQAK